MPKSTSLNFTQNVNFKGAAIANADGTTLKTLYTAGANDAVVKALNLASNDSAAANIALYINDGATDYLLGTINVPALSGSNGTAAAVDAFSGALIPGLPYDANGKRVLPMKAGHILKVGALVAVTAAKTVTAAAIVEEY